MIGSIVLALFLLCQSINIGRCLRANDTRANSDETSQRRLKRSLTFTRPSMLLLIFGLGTPLQLDRESVIVGMFTKMWYALPNNATDFTEPGVYYARASRSRWSFYKMFEKVMAIYGFGGKECLLRAICEVAYVPFDVHHGVLGQLVQAFLRMERLSRTHHVSRDARSATFAMSRLFLWVFSTLGLWANPWWCRGILLYPENTLYQFTLGITVPVAMTKKGGIAFNVGYQLNFVLPWNLSQFEPTIISARHIRDLDLQETYIAIENLLDEHGWRDGRQCLLRSICELAEAPLRRTEQDVLEEMIHLILTPTEDLPVAINSSHRSANKLYQEAERLGRSGGDCILTYSDCIESPLESFTMIVYP